MTYDEAIEKMAAELFGDLAKSECYEVARAQAEAIGLREMMERLAELEANVFGERDAKDL